MRLEVALLPLLFLVECNAYAFVGEPHYIETGECRVYKACVYTYEAVLSHGVDIQRQNVTVSTTFEVACSSTGEYAYHKATKYCLSVTENFVKHEGSAGTENTELDQQLSGWFCFVQTESGKIPIVLHPQNETRSIVNFKKALVTGFQANFDGTEAVEEIDTESVHMSHYRYIDTPRHPWSGHMYRHFTQNDIDRTSTPSSVPIHYFKEEEIKYENGVLSHAHGDTHIVIPQQHHYRPHVQYEDGMQESLLNQGTQYNPRPKRQSVDSQNTAQTYYPFVTLDQFSVSGTYTLDLAHCYSSGVAQRNTRDIQESMSGEYIATSLTAVSDRESLADDLPVMNIKSILEYIHSHPDANKQVQTVKRYLVLEDKTNSASSITEAVHYLNNIRLSMEPNDIAMREKLYAMLAPLTNSDAQEVLLSCVEDVSNATEWNSLLLNIALLVNPSTLFVTQLQSLITTNSARDSRSLLLVYGALASRADSGLQSEMVAFMNDRLQESVECNDDVIALINALGNTGSPEIVDILLDFIGYDNNIDVQVTAINAMRKQTGNVHVLSTFLDILHTPDQNVQVVGAIANTLIRAVELSGVADVQVALDLADALVSSSKTLNNDYISELVSCYLHQLSQHNVRVSRRLRRDINPGNWMSSGPEYNVIASYDARQEDGVNYPIQSAYLWSKEVGIRNFNMQVVAGVFTGANSGGDRTKTFGRAVAKVNVFGKTVTAMEVEVVRTQRSYGDVNRVVYVTVGEFVLLNFEAFSDDEVMPSLHGSDTEYPIFEFSWESFVTVATVTTQMVTYTQMGSYFGIDVWVDEEQNTFTSEGFFSPSLTVRVEGSSTFDVMGTQGETGLNGVIGYAFEADSSISDCMYGPPTVTVRTNIVDQFPRAYINLSTRYKGQWTEPCGFKQCTFEEDKVQDSVPVERWVMPAKKYETLWEDYMHSGSTYTMACPPNTEVHGTQQPQNQDGRQNSESWTIRNEVPTRIPSEDYADQPEYPVHSQPYDRPTYDSSPSREYPQYPNQ